jgi:hypothetical protein
MTAVAARLIAETLTDLIDLIRVRMDCAVCFSGRHEILVRLVKDKRRCRARPPAGGPDAHKQCALRHVICHTSVTHNGTFAAIGVSPTTMETAMNEMFKPDEEIINLTEMREAEEDVGRNTSDNPTMGDIINRRFSRRGFLGGSLAVTAIATTVSPLALMIADEARAEGMSAFSFTEVEAGVDETHHVAEGYDADVLLRWGDKVFADSPEFDPMNQTAESQSKQFGYNNDYVGFIPLDGADDHGLLVVNHEYTNAELMFPNWATIGKDGEGKDKVMMGEFTKDIVDIEMAAHGGTVIEIRKQDGKWMPVLDGKMNRRLHVGTEMALTGPAAGHDRLKTNADPVRHEGPRHAQQLRRRRHALGHMADGRGKLPRLLHRRTARRPSRSRELQALRRARRLVQLGHAPRPLRCVERTK